MTGSIAIAALLLARGATLDEFPAIQQHLGNRAVPTDPAQAVRDVDEAIAAVRS